MQWRTVYGRGKKRRRKREVSPLVENTKASLTPIVELYDCTRNVWVLFSKQTEEKEEKIKDMRVPISCKIWEVP